MDREEWHRLREERRHLEVLVRRYWNVRQLQGASQTKVAKEVGLPGVTFRRWMGLDATLPPPRRSECYRDDFVPVEIGERVLAFGPPVVTEAVPPGAAESSPVAEPSSPVGFGQEQMVTLTLGNCRVEGIPANLLLPILKGLK